MSQVDRWIKGEPVTSACEEIKLFNLCRSMKWAHLPNAGGLYDQDPGLLERFEYIFGKIAEHEQEEHKRQEKEHERERKRMSSGKSSPRPSRMRR